ncbi:MULTISPECIES: hypothetical protein [unclassified Nostoc]|uniref:hypothetical protein n=1 Tax=unclassified Nostoc TaxID=2593658 RepID=UPI000D0BF7E3|nr:MULTISPECIES: hypothetical protein [unclassified Nostoc]AVH66906.1 hypothetical protein NPM_5469 [Nostoc sp. 'Peltigera membranacea cyanobiont' N6]
MPRETSEANEVDRIVTRLLVILLTCWHETGFGHIEVKSERIKRGQIVVTIMGSTHYRYVINNEDLQNWLMDEKKSNYATSEFQILTQLNKYQQKTE